MLDTVLFVAFPYLAVTLTIGVSLYRYFSNRYSYSSLSSELLERRWLFWGAIPWHYGIVPLLLIHLGDFAVPGFMALLRYTPLMLYGAELIGKVLVFMCIVGMTLLIVRRLSHYRLRILTSAMDWIVMLLLLNQVVLGALTSIVYRWGGVWIEYTATPWIVSLASFNPQVQYVSQLPLIPKLHILNATLLIALFPFSRLVHLVTFPITYAWRRFQVVIWNRRPSA